MLILILFCTVVCIWKKDLEIYLKYCYTDNMDTAKFAAQEVNLDERIYQVDCLRLFNRLFNFNFVSVECDHNCEYRVNKFDSNIMQEFGKRFMYTQKVPNESIMSKIYARLKFVRKELEHNYHATYTELKIKDKMKTSFKSKENQNKEKMETNHRTYDKENLLDLYNKTINYTKEQIDILKKDHNIVLPFPHKQYKSISEENIKLMNDIINGKNIYYRENILFKNLKTIQTIKKKVIEYLNIYFKYVYGDLFDDDKVNVTKEMFKRHSSKMNLKPTIKPTKLSLDLYNVYKYVKIDTLTNDVFFNFIKPEHMLKYMIDPPDYYVLEQMYNSLDQDEASQDQDEEQENAQNDKNIKFKIDSDSRYYINTFDDYGFRLNDYLTCNSIHVRYSPYKIADIKKDSHIDFRGFEFGLYSENNPFLLAEHSYTMITDNISNQHITSENVLNILNYIFEKKHYSHYSNMSLINNILLNIYDDHLLKLNDESQFISLDEIEKQQLEYKTMYQNPNPNLEFIGVGKINNPSSNNYSNYRDYYLRQLLKNDNNGLDDLTYKCLKSMKCGRFNNYYGDMYPYYNDGDNGNYFNNRIKGFYYSNEFRYRKPLKKPIDSKYNDFHNICSYSNVKEVTDKLKVKDENSNLINKYFTPAFYCYLESYSNDYRYHLEIELEDLINCEQQKYSDDRLEYRFNTNQREFQGIICSMFMAQNGYLMGKSYLDTSPFNRYYKTDAMTYPTNIGKEEKDQEQYLNQSNYVLKTQINVLYKNYAMWLFNLFSSLVNSEIVFQYDQLPFDLDVFWMQSLKKDNLHMRYWYKDEKLNEIMEEHVNMPLNYLRHDFPMFREDSYINHFIYLLTSFWDKKFISKLGKGFRLNRLYIYLMRPMMTSLMLTQINEYTNKLRLRFGWQKYCLLNQQYRRLIDTACSLKPLAINLLQIVSETKEYAKQCFEDFMSNKGCIQYYDEIMDFYNTKVQNLNWNQLTSKQFETENVFYEKPNINMMSKVLYEVEFVDYTSIEQQDTFSQFFLKMYRCDTNYQKFELYNQVTANYHTLFNVKNFNYIDDFIKKFYPELDENIEDKSLVDCVIQHVPRALRERYSDQYEFYNDLYYTSIFEYIIHIHFEVLKNYNYPYYLDMIYTKGMHDKFEYFSNFMNYNQSPLYLSEHDHHYLRVDDGMDRNSRRFRTFYRTKIPQLNIFRQLNCILQILLKDVLHGRVVLQKEYRGYDPMA